MKSVSSNPHRFVLEKHLPEPCTLHLQQGVLDY